MLVVGYRQHIRSLPGRLFHCDCDCNCFYLLKLLTCGAVSDGDQQDMGDGSGSHC